MKEKAKGRPKKAGKTGPESVQAGDDRLYVEALARGFRILEAFSQGPRPLSLSELAALSGIDKSGVQRMVHTLVQIGYLEKQSGGVMLGRKLLDRSFDYLRGNPIVQQAVPVLADLRRSIQERVDLSLFDDLTMHYVVRMQSKRETLFANLVGRRVPTFCTSGGRSVLSHLPDDQVMDILQRSDLRKLTPRTVVDIPEILAKIAEVRTSGYSVAIEQVMMGEVAVAAAVLDRNGSPIGAIHVSGSLADWAPEDFVARAGPLVTAAAAGLRSL